MELLLKGFVFHKIETIQHKKEIYIFPKKHSVVLPDPKAQSLVANILTSFEGEGNMAYAGVQRDSWFHNKMRGYVVGNLPDFYNFSIQCLERLRDEMSKETASTGGFLTIIDFEMDSEPFLMVVLIKNTKGIGINDNLELEEINTLDIDKLHFAACVNINRWLSEDEEQRVHHVSFLKGRNRKDTVVGYFKSMLCIDESEYLDPSKHTQQLVAIVKNYCESNMTEDEALDARRSIKNLAERKIADGEVITLWEVARLIDPAEPERFFKFIEESGDEIPAEFHPVSKFIERLVKYKFTGPNKEYTLSFEQSALENHTIYLNDQGYIVITQVPAAIQGKLPRR
jgi:nucleoid-associated protein